LSINDNDEMCSPHRHCFFPLVRVLFIALLTLTPFRWAAAASANVHRFDFRLRLAIAHRLLGLHIDFGGRPRTRAAVSAKM